MSRQRLAFLSAMPRDRVLVAGCVVISVLLASAAAKGYALQAALGLGAVAALLVGVRDWRLSIYGLIVFLPVSGVVTVASYQEGGIAVLAKDFLFVIPAYIGFALRIKRASWTFPGAPILPIGVMAIWVVGQCFNPGVPNYLVALVGLKVWLFYVPLLFLGYHLFPNAMAVRRALALMSGLALVPIVAGLIEALLVSRGQAKLVYDLYGSAAGASTQGFFGTTYASGGLLTRIPSTFAFAALYFTFTATMLVVAYAWWRLSRHRLLGILIMGTILLASFTSGARAAFIMVPALLILIVLLDGKRSPAVAVILLMVGGLLAATAIVGADPAEVISHASSVGSTEVQESFLSGVAKAIQLSPLGFGTGTATGATRYISSQVGPYGLPFSESWWVKVILELGLPGLVIVGSLMIWIGVRALRSHRAIKDSGLKGVSAALIAFLLWNFVYATKGFYIDLDPINVYFWLFAGIACRLAFFDNVSDSANGSRQMNNAVRLATVK